MRVLGVAVASCRGSRRRAVVPAGRPAQVDPSERTADLARWPAHRGDRVHSGLGIGPTTPADRSGRRGQRRSTCTDLAAQTTFHAALVAGRKPARFPRRGCRDQTGAGFRVADGWRRCFAHHHGCRGRGRLWLESGWPANRVRQRRQAGQAGERQAAGRCLPCRGQRLPGAIGTGTLAVVGGAEPGRRGATTHAGRRQPVHRAAGSRARADLDPRRASHRLYPLPERLLGEFVQVGDRERRGRWRPVRGAGAGGKQHRPGLRARWRCACLCAAATRRPKQWQCGLRRRQRQGQRRDTGSGATYRSLCMAARRPRLVAGG